MANAISVKPAQTRKFEYVPRTVKTMTIAHKGGSLTASVEQLPCGTLIQRENAAWTHPNGKVPSYEILGGTVWVPNRALDRLTGGETTYMKCENVYDALRLSIHANTGYGVSTSHPGSETVALQSAIARARSSTTMTAEAKQLELKKLETELAKKRDARKQKARAWFTLAIRTTTSDSLGRPNPSAARMRVGAGIGEIIGRLHAIGNIDQSTGRKAGILGDYIEEILRTYDALWSDLAGQEDLERGGKIAQGLVYMARSLDSKSNEIEKDRGEKAVRNIRSILMGHQEAFFQICAAPYCRNAFRTRADLAEAIALCENLTKLPELREVLARIKEGIRWAYAQSYLNAMILFPLSTRLEYHRLVARDKNRLLKQRTRLPFASYLVQFSPHFEDMCGEIEDFKARIIAKCKDDRLVTRVRDNVLSCVAKTEEAVKAKQWLAVRKHLKAVVAIL